MTNHINFIKELVKQGGSRPEKFAELNSKLNAILSMMEESNQTEEITESIREALGEALSIDTIQGYGFHKPYGYSGDFYMIDKIYQQYVSPNENLQNWDIFFHAQKAPMAVRNRKQYFIEYLFRLRKHEKQRPLHILNLASGPCRDVCEYLDQTQDLNTFFHCVDHDSHAIEYARKVCAKHLNQITFYHRNALRCHLRSLSWALQYHAAGLLI